MARCKPAVLASAQATSFLLEAQCPAVDAEPDSMPVRPFIGKLADEATAPPAAYEGQVGAVAGVRDELDAALHCLGEGGRPVLESAAASPRKSKLPHPAQT